MTEAATAATTEVVTKPKREKRHGQTRPEVGTKTGLIWDIADRLTEESGVVATKEDVWNEYKDKVEGPAEATVATQFGRWVIYNDYSEQVKAARKAAKDAKTSSEQEEKEKKAAEKAAAKKKKEDEKAAAKAKKEAEKKAKADAAAASKESNSPAVVGVEAEDQDNVELPDGDADEADADGAAE